ncbi:MAG: nucleoside phosphorylase [Thermodesulfobacteriota bacterium]
MEKQTACTQPPGPDTEEGIVRPVKRKSDPGVGPEAILVIIPSDLDYLQEITQARRSTTHDMGHFKLHRVERERGKCFSIAGPFLGAPHAAMGMEKMIALGASRIFVLGWCGSLQQRVRIGDFVIPTDALSEEGTSRHYPIGERPARTDMALTVRLEDALRGSGGTTWRGPVWTTDAVYRETPSKILQYQGMGVLAVDMETSALITLGVYRSVQVAGLLVVSDELSDLKWKPGFRSPVFREACRSAARVLLNIMDSQDIGPNI